MTNPHQIETIVSLRKNQAKDMLRTLSLMSSEEANNCKERADAFTQALRAYYQQPVASQYNLNEALDTLVTLTDRSQKLVHAEQQRFLEFNNKPSLALYTGCPDQFIPDQIKNQRLQPFLPPRDRNQSRPTQGGGKIKPSEQETKETQSGLKGSLPKEGQSTSPKNQDFGTVESLNFYKCLCNIEDSLLVVFNKLNDTHYANGIVNLSSYTLTKSETSVLSKGLGFCPTPGAPDIGNII